MDLFDTGSSITTLCAIAMVVGVFGVVIPMLPGLILCWLAVVAWAVFAADGWGRWAVVAVASVVALVGVVAKYAWPGRRLKRSGVPNRTLLAGGLLGLVGFFVVPVVGLPLGFVLGVYLAELARVKESRLAWPSTKRALAAAGLAMLIELGSALGVAAVWVAGLLLT